jgi:Sec-independent protein translocase protein TatA
VCGGVLWHVSLGYIPVRFPRRAGRVGNLYGGAKSEMAQNENKQQSNGSEGPQERKANAVAAAAQAGAPVAQDTTAEQATKQSRGGKQEDQISGETEKGAHNNEARGSNNPQGN